MTSKEFCDKLLPYFDDYSSIEALEEAGIESAMWAHSTSDDEIILPPDVTEEFLKNIGREYIIDLLCDMDEEEIQAFILSITGKIMDVEKLNMMIENLEN